MKLVKDLLKLNESIGSEISAKTLKSKDFLKKLSLDIQQSGFPAKFTITVETSYGDSVPCVFEIDSKHINDEAQYHTVSFEYRLTSESSKNIHKLIMSAEGADEDGEKFDTLNDELGVDTIVVNAEFSSQFEKIWATAS